MGVDQICTEDENSTLFERLVDVVIDRIIAFTDYFIVKKHVTLSEAALFAFAAAWSLWFMFVGPVVDPAIGRAFGVTIFSASAAAHFIAFFFKDTLARALVACHYAFMWCFLTALSAYTKSEAPAVPTMAVLTMLSVFIAVRLFRDGQQ